MNTTTVVKKEILRERAIRLLNHKLLKFSVVGVSGIVVNNIVLLLLVHYGMQDIVASIIATECAIITNFIGNSLWTWREHKGGVMRKFWLFQAISMVTGALTVALFWLLHDIFGMQLLVANTIAILVTFLMRFSLNDKYTWRKNENA